jgi:integral membrane sensor domain MASE1
MRQMPLTCNIDAQGKRARLLSGLFMLAVGACLAIFLAHFGGGSILVWVIPAVSILIGAFCIFEARAGWCAMRAMGFKTKR